MTRARWRRSIGVMGTIAALGAVVLVPAQAQEPTRLPVVSGIEVRGGGPTFWDMRNDGSACETSDRGFTPVSDGAFGPDYAMSDAFDDGLMVSVNGDDIPDLDGTLAIKGDDVLVRGRKVSGVRITRAERALSSSPTLRSLISFDNRSTSKKQLTVQWDSDLGSDSSEAVRATSDGDTTYELTDRWVVSSDDATTPGDPVLGFILFGKNARQAPKTIVNDLGSGCFTVEYRFKVPAHSMRHLLFFTQMTGTNSKGIAKAMAFDSPSKGLFSGLSTKVKNAVLNWNV